MPDTPSQELRRAAKLMRERAEAATPGPWEYVNDHDITHGWEINEHGRAQANWIATVDAGDDELDEAGPQAHDRGEHAAERDSWCGRC